MEMGGKEFSGTVELYNKKIFIDTKTGDGYKELFHSIKKMVEYMASKYQIQGFDIDDNIQYINVCVLESIKNFDPTKNMKLSTFLQMIVKRRMINRLRDDRSDAKNAHMLNINRYKIKCDCGFINSIIIGDENLNKDIECYQCWKQVDFSKKMKLNFQECNTYDYCFIPDDDYSSSSPEYHIQDINIFGEPNWLTDDVIINHIDISDAIKSSDNYVGDSIKLIYEKDLNVRGVAEHLNISHGMVNFRLKALAKKNKIKEIFGVEN